MSRKRAATIRNVKPDAKYKSVMLAKFINCTMYQGCKSVAENIVYSALERASEKLGKEPLVCFEAVIDNVKPIIEVYSQRFGGATFQVPKEVRPSRSIRLAFMWILNASRKRASGKGMLTMVDKLSAEFVDAFNGTGTAIKKREDTHKMAEANRAFAHLARKQ